MNVIPIRTQPKIDLIEDYLERYHQSMMEAARSQRAVVQKEAA